MDGLHVPLLGGHQVSATPELQHWTLHEFLNGLPVLNSARPIYARPVEIVSALSEDH